MRKAPVQPGRRDHVLALCHMLSNRIGKAFASELAQYDVTVAEWRVLLTLGVHGNTSGRGITSRWAMDKMAVNRAIASLEGRGLIEKARNSGDRRIIDLSLTAAGRALYEEMLPAANRRYHKLMACLDKSEARRFHEILTRMIAHADAMAE